jgi:hypothetical protein
LHDNAPAHRALATQKKLAYLGFQCLDDDDDDEEDDDDNDDDDDDNNNNNNNNVAKLRTCESDTSATAEMREKL